MNSQIALFGQIYSLTHALYEKALDGLGPEDLHKSAGPESNPMIWVAAHLAHVRCSLLRMLGQEMELPWGGCFGKGQNPDPDKYPEIGEVLLLWRQTGQALLKRFESLTEADLSQKASRDFPIADKTLVGAIHFLAFHEGYHVGQMAYLRKWLGKESLVG
jgi:hypothetical protein